MDYLNLLNHSFAKHKEDMQDSDISKLEYLSDNIFGFTTYENIVSSKMAEKCLEVCVAITNKKTFEYIATDEGNLWYLIMVNMPFFAGKLEWGTSIRGAWWDTCNKKFKIDSCGLYEGEEQLLRIEFTDKQWIGFVNAMVQFKEI